MKRKDRIPMQGGITHLPAEFREVARLANQAGLEGYKFESLKIGIDTENLPAVAGGLIDDMPALESRIEITYDATCKPVAG